MEACIGVLGIQDTIHFTSRDMAYYPFYFQGYGKLSILLSEILNTIHFTSRDMGYCVQYCVYFKIYWIFKNINYGDVCQFVRDACLFTSIDIVLVTIYTNLSM